MSRLTGAAQSVTATAVTSFIAEQNHRINGEGTSSGDQGSDDFTHAAELAYEKLKVTASSAEDRSSCEYLAKEMDESLARSGNALLFDLRNSIAQCLSDPGSAGILDSMGPAAVDYLSKGGIANYRAVYQQTAQRSENTAELNLDKWLYNEALFPVFWENYIRGRVPTLPDAPSKTSTPLAQTK